MRGGTGRGRVMRAGLVAQADEEARCSEMAGAGAAACCWRRCCWRPARTPGVRRLSCDPCAVGVAFDGPWERNTELQAAFEEEIPALAAPRFTVVFPPGARRVADWTLEGAAGIVGAFLLAVWGFGAVPNPFFPPSDRATFTATYELPAGTSIERTLEIVAAVDRFIESELGAGEEGPRGSRTGRRS